MGSRSRGNTGKLEAGNWDYPILQDRIILCSYCMALAKNSGSVTCQAWPVLIKPVPSGLELRDVSHKHHTACVLVSALSSGPFASRVAHPRSQNALGLPASLSFFINRNNLIISANSFGFCLLEAEV